MMRYLGIHIVTLEYGTSFGGFSLAINQTEPLLPSLMIEINPLATCSHLKMDSKNRWNSIHLIEMNGLNSGKLKVSISISFDKMDTYFTRRKI